MIKRPRLKDSLWAFPIALIISAFLHQQGVGDQWPVFNFVIPHAAFSVLIFYSIFWLGSSVARKMRNGNATTGD